MINFYCLTWITFARNNISDNKSMILNANDILYNTDNRCHLQWGNIVITLARASVIKIKITSSRIFNSHAVEGLILVIRHLYLFAIVIIQNIINGLPQICTFITMKITECSSQHIATELQWIRKQQDNRFNKIALFSSWYDNSNDV